MYAGFLFAKGLLLQVHTLGLPVPERDWEGCHPQTKLPEFIHITKTTS